MGTSVICIANNESNAAEIVRRLKAESFADNDISVLLPDKSGTRDFATEHSTKAPEGAIAGAGAGGVLGGSLGLLVGIGALAIPGVGPFIAAGPILAALSGAAVGAAVGGLAGALVGLGLPEYEAKQYEGKIRKGGILISAHCVDKDRQARAKRIMEECGAEDIAAVGEKSTPTGDSDASRPVAPRSPANPTGPLAPERTVHPSARV